jgi:CheY-like chemotaxis protein
MVQRRHGTNCEVQGNQEMTRDELGQSQFLIVDDDALSRDIMAGVLDRIGCGKVLCAENADSGLSLARHHKPDFILLDIYMPQVDGWALLDKLRAALPKVVVLMITGSIRPDDFKKSLDKHVDGFCIKPVLPNIMLKALTQAHERRQALR